MLGNNLPEDLMEEIMVRLPIKSLLRFKCVAKSWYALITEHSFIAKQFERYDSIHKNRRLMLGYEMFTTKDLLLPMSLIDTREQPYETQHIESPLPEKHLSYMIVFGQCNGIFCLCGYYYPGVQRLFLWNPATKEVKDILSFQLKPMNWDVYGFGFDSITKDFKVVTFPSMHDNERHHQPQIYNLSTNSWRELDVDFSFFKSCFSSLVGPYLNGAYHWYITHSHDDTDDKFVASFDFSKEAFGIIPCPAGITITSSNFEENLLAVVDESLAWVVRHVSIEVCLEIWVMNEYGVKSSWTKKFEIRPFPYPFPWYAPQIFRDNEIIVYHNINRQYIAYDLRNQTREMLQDFRYRTDYVESLFSLGGQGKHKQI